MWEISILNIFRFLICISSEISVICIRKIFINLFNRNLGLVIFHVLSELNDDKSP